tara:strand:+ start:679 stop:930 length:252 start_codon:yes stop_codon:yes gene_type:complete
MSQIAEPSEPVPSIEDLSIHPELPTLSIRRERSIAKWESHKEEIYELYVEQNIPLKQVMQALETKHGFKFRYACLVPALPADG